MEKLAQLESAVFEELVKVAYADQKSRIDTGYGVGEMEEFIIRKTAELSVMAADAIRDNHMRANLTKEASEAVDRLTEPEMSKYAEDMVYAQGVAVGEQYGHREGISKYAREYKLRYLDYIAAMYGKNAAEAVEQATTEGEDTDAIVEEVAQIAAEKMVDNLGKENVESSPELQETIDDIAHSVGQQVADEINGSLLQQGNR
jgi:protein-tyrosine-phosphatase